MVATFPGVFAGKIAFCSSVPNVNNLYLTTNRISNGQHGWIYIPGMNAPSATATEKYLIYLYPDNYYRIQSGDLRWLGLNENGGFIQFADDVSDAAAFAISGNPFGSQIAVKTSTGDQQLFYLFEPNPSAPNVLGVAQGTDHYNTFVPTIETVSLAAVREQKQAAGADFTNAILIGQDLSQGIDFTGAFFSGAQLAGVNFTNARLDKADFSQTDLRGLNWGSPASAAGINLSGSVAADCVFGGQTNRLDCSGANFSSADLTGATLTNLNLQKASLAGASLISTVLDKADLTGAILNGVVALKSSFIGAILTDATAQMGIFSGAVFDNANLTRVKMGARIFFELDSQFVNELDQYSYPQSDLITAFQSNGIVLQPNAAIVIVVKGQSWQIKDPNGPFNLFLTGGAIQVFDDNPNLVPAVLRGASLKGVTAPTASLAGADLRGVQWYAAPATLDHADLLNAVFSGSLLVSLDLTQANVSGADFSNCILTQAKFIGCVAGPGGSGRAISFEAAHLEGADFSKATFSGALLSDAVVSLDAGVPLFFLPVADQQYLNAAGINSLIPVFHQAGFDLGSSPAITDNSFWNIDNSQCTDPQAPKLYKVQKASSGFNVFASGQFLFALPAADAPFFNQHQAAPQLVSIFSNHHYNLALNAPITVFKSWLLAPGSDAIYVRSYRFNNLQIFVELNRLSVYGIAPVLIENLSQYPSGVAFNATQNLANALSSNAVGPASVPFSWIGQNRIDEETFFTAP
jgi:uncharacterized protein YjbI with pentapeptide repeats